MSSKKQVESTLGEFILLSKFTVIYELRRCKLTRPGITSAYGTLVWYTETQLPGFPPIGDNTATDASPYSHTHRVPAAHRVSKHGFLTIIIRWVFRCPLLLHDIRHRLSRFQSVARISTCWSISNWGSAVPTPRGGEPWYSQAFVTSRYLSWRHETYEVSNGGGSPSLEASVVASFPVLRGTKATAVVLTYSTSCAALSAALDFSSTIYQRSQYSLLYLRTSQIFIGTQNDMSIA